MITVALVSLAAALVVICCMGVCGFAWTWRRHLSRRRVHARLSAAGCCGPRRVEEPKETRLQALQRRFVAGEISLDQYERDIDRLPQRPTPA